MSCTELIMAPIMPGHSGLESIGSVASNFARLDAEEAYPDYARLKKESARSYLSEYLLSTHGQVTYEENIAWLKAEAERAQREKEKRRELRARLRRRWKMFYTRVLFLSC